jgi:Flp pilus assembly pilin Flp
MRVIRDFLRHEPGTTAIEYGLIAAVQAVGSGVNTKLGTVEAGLK